MRTLVIGTGGIGGTIAACLVRRGIDVTPVTGNPAIAQALARDGYHVTDLDGSAWSVPSPVTPLASLPPSPGAPRERFDLCIVATQSTRLEAALHAARPHLTDHAVVVTCQNGLPEERAIALLGDGGAARVLGCVVGWGASMTAPGRYLRTSKGTLTLGRPTHAAPDPAPISRLLEAASEVRLAPDLAAARWSKLAINCVITTIGAVSGQRLGALLRHRFARRLALEVFAEVAAVARAQGVRPAPIAGTLDIERVAISRAERRQRLGSPSLAWKHSILWAVGIKFRRMRSSMLYALERGRPPEIDYLNGEVVRRGHALGVPVPVNEALVETVHRLAAARDASRHPALVPSLELLHAIYERVIEGRGSGRGTSSEEESAEEAA